MKLNLKTTLKTLEGEPFKNNNKDFTLGEALANMLSASEEQGKMKLYILATKFYEQESIDLDASDLALVKKVVASSRAYSGSLIQGQVELLLETKE